MERKGLLDSVLAHPKKAHLRLVAGSKGHVSDLTSFSNVLTLAFWKQSKNVVQTYSMKRKLAICLARLGMLHLLFQSRLSVERCNSSEMKVNLHRGNALAALAESGREQVIHAGEAWQMRTALVRRWMIFPRSHAPSKAGETLRGRRRQRIRPLASWRRELKLLVVSQAVLHERARILQHNANIEQHDRCQKIGWITIYELIIYKLRLKYRGQSHSKLTTRK